jgi:glycine dehydrogenase subunit 1
MDVANASMYDGATALAEAVIMAAELTGRKRVLLPATVNREYRRVAQTYIEHMGLELTSIPAKGGRLDVGAVEAALGDDSAALVVQHPNFCGALEDVDALSAAAKRHGALVISVYHPLSLGLLKPPGAYDADIAVAEGQSLGCPMGYGGPLLGLFACKERYLRRIPGRLIGQTTDQDGKRAYVMTLRTREQDIRRERATSNICTNEALNALAACVYMATMGKTGIRQVAELSLQKAHYAAQAVAALPGFRLAYPDAPFFNEFVVRCPIAPEDVNDKLLAAGMIGGLPLGSFDPDLADAMLVCVTEQRLKDEIDRFVTILGGIAR